MLSTKIDNNRLIENASMKDHTSFKVGGISKLLVLPENIDEIKNCIDICKENNIEYFIMGNGSNLIIKDTGFNGVIIKLSNNYKAIEVHDEEIIASAGTLMSSIASKALHNSLAGFEFASGIPGTIGGAVVMNAGAYGKEIKDIVEKIDVIDDSGEIKNYHNSELDFNYRHSKIQDSKETIIRVYLKLEKGNKENIADEMKALTKRRNEKQPIEYPSAGSVFKRPKGHYAGQLIQDSGLKGLTLGGAKVSPKHAGFIVNQGDATAEDIINLIQVVKKTVFDKFGVMLETEVRIIGDKE